MCVESHLGHFKAWSCGGLSLLSIKGLEHVRMSPLNGDDESIPFSSLIEPFTKNQDLKLCRIKISNICNKIGKYNSELGGIRILK